MKHFVYEANGYLFDVTAPDMDRARCRAKAEAGANWTPKARLVKVYFGGAA